MLLAESRIGSAGGCSVSLIRDQGLSCGQATAEQASFRELSSVAAEIKQPSSRVVFRFDRAAFLQAFEGRGLQIGKGDDLKFRQSEWVTLKQCKHLPLGKILGQASVLQARFGCRHTSPGQAPAKELAFFSLGDSGLAEILERRCSLFLALCASFQTRSFGMRETSIHQPLITTRWHLVEFLQVCYRLKSVISSIFSRTIRSILRSRPAR